MEGSNTTVTSNAPGSGNGVSLVGGSSPSITTTSPSLPQHASSQRTSNIVDEESPLLSLETTAVITSTSPIPDLLNALQNLDTTATSATTSASSQEPAHLPQHYFGLERNHSAGAATTSSPTTPSIPDPLPFINMEDTRRIHSEGSVALSSSSSFLSPQNLQPTAPPVYESRPSRRRLASRHQRRSGGGTTSTSTSNLRRSPTNNVDGNTNDDIDSTGRRRRRGSNNNSLRASLDAGMAAVQRWIRSRSSSAASSSEPSASSGRSVTWSNHRESSSEVISLSSRSAGLNNTATTGSLNNPDEESHAGHRSLSHVHNNHPTTIFEEDEDALGRQRALSESDVVRIRDIFRSMGARRRRGGRSGHGTENVRQLSSSAAAALYSPATNPAVGNPSAATAPAQAPAPPDFLFAPVETTSSPRERSVTDGGLDNFRYMEPLEMTGPPAVGETSSVSTEHSEGTGGDSERRARARWMQINRRFQFVITAVALLFSLLLFAILICWVVLTSAYVVSFDKRCDVPLKPYFWLVTFQLVLDVFRTDIMRFVFDWDSSSNQRIPSRVIIYNVTYLLYALLVLRLGVRSVFASGDTECRDTAPELYNASAAFVSLSLAAWATIICGYLLPFFVVAALLTCNGYNPSAAAQQSAAGATQPVFPAAYATTGAPQGTIDMLHVLRIEDFPEDYPRECCICMEPFGQKAVVETSCKHVFHKQCCREWLRQARSCPVCRMDIPSACQNSAQQSNSMNNGEASGGRTNAAASGATEIPIGPTGRPVVGLWRALRRQSLSMGSSGGEEE